MFRLVIVVAFVVRLTQAAPQPYGVPMLDGRIVGGEPTLIEEYPYQASLLYFSSHRCGAVIISEDYVLTAAHCTEWISASYLSIRAGSTFRNSGGIVIQVATIYQNENYDNETLDYDISVLQLASSLSFGSAIAPVPLPELNQPIVPGAISQVSGWGRLSETGGLPNQLQVVEVPVIGLEECAASYGANYTLTHRMMCAGFPEGVKDACDGDSGGPLVVNGTLIGLVSWGEGCARAGYPGVYASVPALRDYITEVTGF